MSPLVQSESKAFQPNAYLYSPIQQEPVTLQYAGGEDTQSQSNWSPVVLRFFDYLTAVPVDRAFRILALWTQDISFEDFAATMVAKIPANWFTDKHFAPAGPRLVFADGRLSLEGSQNPDQRPTVLPFHAFTNPSEVMHSPPEPPARRRALNSFMAFRSYFSSLFPGVRQSVKSSLLSEIWSDDPLKSHWSLMARAYTLIRDNFRIADPTLPLFIRLVAAFMGIPGPKNYLLLCGFTVEEHIGPERKYTISGPNPNERIIPHVHTVTIFDIVEFLQCHPEYQMEQYESSIWPYDTSAHENGQMAVRIDPDNPAIDDPLDCIFDERNWNLDIEDTYSVVDDSIDPARDLIYWPAIDVESLIRLEEERVASSAGYRARRNAGLIPGVPPFPNYN